MLPFRAQGLAAGRQDLHARRAAQHLGRQGGGSLDEVLAVIEHKQHLLALQCRDRAVDRVAGADLQAEPGGECARHQTRVEQRRQIDEAGAVLA